MRYPLNDPADNPAFPFYSHETKETRLARSSPSAPSAWAHSVGKRCLDMCGASALLLAAAVPMAVIVLGIKWNSKGPIFFHQPRIGYDDSVFTLHKFRTMKREYCDPRGEKQTRKNDPRVTSFGRFLRRTRLDELPQLWNVLKGDMSLVGPRAISFGTADRLTDQPDYAVRLSVKPGLTSPALVADYRLNLHDMKRTRVALTMDKDYVEQASLWTDLRTLLKTSDLVLNPPAHNY